MHNFAYIKAETLEDALAALDAGDGAALLAGGTDLIPLMKDEMVTPHVLLDITSLRQMNYVEERDGRVHIGATTTLSDLAAHPLVKEQYTALAQACAISATPQLRNMGTIGGNILQQPRCWYYRGEHDCWLKGGEVCYARNGENELHAIFMNTPEQSRCVSAHPSDPAVALLLFDAEAVLRTAKGETALPLRDLFAVPTPERRNGVSLPSGSIITELVLNPAHGGRSTYLKAMPRASWAFALASVGLYVNVSGGLIQDVRIGLGGVAPVPMRVPNVEGRLLGQAVAQLDADAVADSLVAGATPLAKNGYKAPLLRGLFKQALSQVLA